MGPIQYDNQAQGSQVPTQGTGGSPNPVLDSLTQAMQHATSQVEAAQKQASQVPAYVKAGQQPTMPVQKPTLFGDASVKNLANQQPQTRAGARNKAIGQIAAQAAGVVGAFQKKKEAEKTQQLALDINRSLELMKGIDEAQQILQQDPNNAQAKAMLQKNQTLMNHLLDDPKRAKAIFKAYDATFGEGAQDEKNKNSQEKKAMTGAMRAAQLQEQMPERLEANPQYAAAQKNVQDMQKQADALLKTYAGMAKGVMDVQSKEKIAGAQIDSREAIADANNKERMAQEALKARTALQVEQDKHKARMAEIAAEGANRLQAIKLTKKLGENDKGQKMAEDWLKNANGGIEKAHQDMARIDAELNKPENKTAEKEDARRDLMTQKDQINQQLVSLQQQRDQALMEMSHNPDASALMSITLGDKY